MKMTKERIIAIQQIKDATVDILDLYDEDGYPRGTKVVFLLPKNLKDQTHEVENNFG